MQLRGSFCRTESGILILSLSIAVGLEIVNTALENLLDLAIPHYHREVKKIKDMLSGAVFFSLAVYVLLVVAFILL